MHELASVRPAGEVRDELERLAGRRERALERIVVVGRDDQLLAAAEPFVTPAADRGGQRGKQLVQGSWRVVAREDVVQLVVEGASAGDGLDVLRDAQEVELLVRG